MARRFTRLLHLGNVVVDLVLDVPALPGRGGDVLAGRSALAPGGGFNVMAAAARQGLPVAYAGALGTGPFAELAQAGLAAEGIDVLRPARPDLDTGVVITLVEADGERTFVTSPGAEATLAPADLAGLAAGPRDAVYLSGYGLVRPGGREARLGWLSRLGAGPMVFFDPGPLLRSIPAAALDQVLARADWLTCNAREAGLLTGAPDPAAALRQLSGRAGRPCAPARDRGVLVRTGAEGCMLSYSGTEPAVIPGFPVKVLDSNGAGDTHTGVFIAALGSGADASEAARTANAAAALSVTRPGPATAPTADELGRFLYRQSWNSSSRH